jgi:arylsulfatase A-like enzyme
LLHIARVEHVTYNIIKMAIHQHTNSNFFNHYCLVILAVIASGISACGDSPNLPSNPKNVVFIVVDTLRNDRLGCYGHNEETSPTIDKLAEESIFFEKAYSTAPWTLPSISSMLTGEHPAVLGTDNDSKLPKRFKTMAELFRDAGYQTAAVSSHIYVTKKYGFAQGFDFFNSNAIIGRDMVSGPVVNARAFQTINELSKSDKPFFLFLHYFDPHYDYLMHDILNTYPDYKGILHSGISIDALRALSKKRRLRAKDKRYLFAAYDSEIRYTDDLISRLFDELRRRKMFDDTLIIFTGDHGEHLGDDRERWIGHTLHVTQKLIHIPLLIRMPKGAVRHRVSSNFSLVDLMPTILRYIGIESPEDISGKAIDLTSNKPFDRVVFSETVRWRKLQAVMSGKWKFTRNMKTQKFQLYNLETDPRGRIDIKDENMETANLLDQKRVEWVEHVKAQQKKFGTAVKEKIKPDLSSEEVQQLKALGYVDSVKDLNDDHHAKNKDGHGSNVDAGQQDSGIREISVSKAPNLKMKTIEVSPLAVNPIKTTDK